MDATTRDSLILVQRVVDKGGRVEALVRVTDSSVMRTSAVPALADEVLVKWPGLRRHRCECGSAHGIAAELADTELPHLLEHVALERMVLAGAPRALRGETRWDFRKDGRGVFRVSLAYADPDTGFEDRALAESALREGARELDELLCELRGR